MIYLQRTCINLPYQSLHDSFHHSQAETTFIFSEKEACFCKSACFPFGRCPAMVLIFCRPTAYWQAMPLEDRRKIFVNKGLWMRKMTENIWQPIEQKFQRTKSKLVGEVVKAEPSATVDADAQTTPTTDSSPHDQGHRSTGAKGGQCPLLLDSGAKSALHMLSVYRFFLYCLLTSALLSSC